MAPISAAFDADILYPTNLSDRFLAFNKVHSVAKRISTGLFRIDIPGLDTEIMSAHTMRLYLDYNIELCTSASIPGVITAYYVNFVQEMNRHDDSGFGWAYLDETTKTIVWEDAWFIADPASFCVLDHEVLDCCLAEGGVAVTQTYHDNAERPLFLEQQCEVKYYKQRVGKHKAATDHASAVGLKAVLDMFAKKCKLMSDTADAAHASITPTNAVAGPSAPILPQYDLLSITADDSQCFGLLLLGVGRSFYGHPAIGQQNFATVLLLGLPQISCRSAAGMGQFFELAKMPPTTLPDEPMMVLVEQILSCSFAARSSHAGIDDIQETMGHLEVTGWRDHAELGPVSVIQGQQSNEHVADLVVDRAVRGPELDNSYDELCVVHKEDLARVSTASSQGRRMNDKAAAVDHRLWGVQATDVGVDKNPGVLFQSSRYQSRVVKDEEMGASIHQNNVWLVGAQGIFLVRRDIDLAWRDIDLLYRVAIHVHAVIDTKGKCQERVFGRNLHALR
ncbi:hypothetical protein DFH07DRAFT_770884 [Mycena maculata]|uniref:Uncharacterized protein n=1 Tax=Mycena maculata TaxID=230809 RepID=A0AAD7JGT9_9AGAR|nr:hypothetical protein DFH07DRAFT_770884 [Mycena maculata]